MQKSFTRTCPVCTHGLGEVLHRARFALPEGVPLTDHYDVVACAQCGFVFADTASTQDDYDAYYRMHSKYEDADTSTGSAVSPIDAARLCKLAEHLASLLPDKKIAIADIGCANGGLLGALQALGYDNLLGVDPSPGCARAVAARGIRAMAGSFSQLPKVDKPLDAVLLTGVLEHVRDVETALRALETILSDRGYLYITVPDAARYDTHILAPFQDFNTEHINHFSVQSLTNLMQRLGYQAVAVEQHISHEAQDVSVPVIYSLFQRTTEKQPTLLPDRALAASVKRYIEASQCMMNDLARQLAAHFSKHPRLILWGTGQLALKLLALPEVKAAQVATLVDGNPINQGKKLLGKPIVSPEQIQGMAEPILVMTTLHHAAIEHKIREQLHMQNALLLLTLNP